MADGEKYIYGPVPSRRLGLSLGVDIIPYKVCTLDCIYCQIGRSTDLTVERKVYVAAKPVLTELERRIASGLRADFITIGGSGEPTLNSELGELIDGIKVVTDIPVAVLTNGTLLCRPDVRADCSGADVVLPSLDAGDQETFERVNRPHVDISIETLVDGLCKFRKEFSGGLWLEVFLVSPLNTDSEHIGKIAGLIERIGPDRIHLNTAVRPTAEAGVKRLALSQMRGIAEELGHGCEIISDFSLDAGGSDYQTGSEDVLAMLQRRPCSIEDIASGLGIHRNEVLKFVTQLEEKGEIWSEQREGALVFRAR